MEVSPERKRMFANSADVPVQKKRPRTTTQCSIEAYRAYKTTTCKHKLSATTAELQSSASVTS